MGTTDAVPIPWSRGYLVDRNGTVFSTRSGKSYGHALRPWLNSTGYEVVSILLKNGKRKRQMVHRIVARVFLGEPKTTDECRHLDGNCRNNSAENLSWGSRSDNMLDSVKHGTHISIAKPWRLARGDRHWCAKHPELIRRGESSSSVLTEQHVVVIREMAKLGISCSAISRAISAPRGAVSCVLQGKTWKHVLKGKN